MCVCVFVCVGQIYVEGLTSNQTRSNLMYFTVQYTYMKHICEHTEKSLNATANQM